MGASRLASVLLPTHPPARPPRSSLGEGERTCEVGPCFFRLLSSGDCDPPARTGSRPDVYGTRTGRHREKPIATTLLGGGFKRTTFLTLQPLGKGGSVGLAICQLRSCSAKPLESRAGP
ncbi:progressive rod-cone degeneration protein isoform X1 [Microtus ochrogaster]|uniref:Progressive rod-cone degeneration protein isoform X1 n=1 Tax=Microtus ochrogaster TaxID=79684 RepID=A0ABM1U2N1_MICOH|nr:progressive rod-cone degeneration protein isoform X1 [Microtus ochrogaster]